ncbi:lipopolysaccharide/colanic/teichoic acid biosynthesis glycosyltransferase [Aquimarina sp. EL_43]|uniref:sugar transferase n=1 Tax=unclassified Aquimarina TaxID=2627091 RepID=UPI0018C9303D|nr:MULTISPECIES: sugar transferase [unclassified Aquimarina]MBG6129915.1 lipopolysaccharide/colanic/teichoic acid biosynthesis glycosyltransferase [Aquimarina sp. EL_35]MBG6150980.1 lipopolysaccharide/colanic/teichoic acid biosynthesis glycosyltransferase [Aquimarina sp. EL_32]MBG6167713.1 lipopolysaccharide/colanic/teichoic acid biosynthesis glycosyltransferase [Aquimarina sp. EL_43]
MYKFFIKRSLDFSVSLLFLIFILPVFILLILFLAIANRGKPFFVQRRPGKNEKIFSIIKFKTMNDRRDAQGNLLPDKDRITRVGAFVRKTSLDEIPQLINVVLGEMSLIGPRPLIIEYLPVYNDVQKKRHNVRPGITGLAQVNGRNSITWKKKFEYDVWYVENYNFLLDLKIIGLTLKKVIQKEDVNLSNDLTSEYFDGTN